MASTYSTNLALELMATGDQSGTWGTTNNTNLGTLIEQAISGYVTQAITDGADTTITIPNGATGVARNMYIEMTGALTAARNLIVPANKKLYFIHNNTTGGYAVTVKVSGQTGVSVPNGLKLLLVSNGTDVVHAVSSNPINGSWTPSIGGTATYFTQLGQYVRTGNLVTFAGHLNINSLGTGSTSVISGLPYTSANSDNLGCVSVGHVTNSANNFVWLTGYVNQNASTIQIIGINAAGASTAAFAFFGNNANIYFSGSYFTA